MSKIKPLSTSEGNKLANSVTIKGARVRTHWRRQADQLHRRLIDEMQQALDNEESTTQALQRVSGQAGIFRRARQAAESLITTAVTAVTNQARLMIGQLNSNTIKGLQQVSVLDGRTSNICIAYAGQAWQIDTLRPMSGSSLPFNGGPPRHFNCRSILVPVLHSWRRLGLSRNQDLDGQLAGDTTVEKWLNNKTKAQQDAVLGRGIAKLYRAGEISHTDLVDQRGRPLTLAQFEENML